MIYSQESYLIRIDLALGAIRELLKQQLKIAGRIIKFITEKHLRPNITGKNRKNYFEGAPAFTGAI